MFPYIFSLKKNLNGYLFTLFFHLLSPALLDSSQDGSKWSDGVSSCARGSHAHLLAPIERAPNHISFLGSAPSHVLQLFLDENTRINARLLRLSLLNICELIKKSFSIRQCDHYNVWSIDCLFVWSFRRFLCVVETKKFSEFGFRCFFVRFAENEVKVIFPRMQGLCSL